MRQKSEVYTGLRCTLTKTRYFFFDSYALVPTQEIVDFLSKHSQRMRNTLEVQSFGESNCGQLSLYVLYKLNKGEPFKDIIISLYRKKNEQANPCEWLWCASLYSTGASSLSKPKADWLYVKLSNSMTI